jgi:hypothetical protein
MKKFLRNIIVFSIIPFIFVISIDFYLRNKNSLYSEKFNGLIKAKKQINVLFLGNSHANYGISPLHFKNYNVYNLANVSQLIYFDKRLTIKAINSGVSNLKYVFISVDYHSLFMSSMGKRNVWSYYSNGIKYKNQNYLKENISPFLWGYSPNVSLSLFIKDFKRIMIYNNAVINFDVENGVNIKDSIYNGFIGFEGTDNASFNISNYKRKAEGFHESTINSERIEVINDLNTFILFLKSKNIQPILFSSPTFKDYNKYLDKNQIKRNLENINLLCVRHNIKYWRFEEDKRFLKEDFYNPDHLNKNGAIKFSCILNNKLKAYNNER